MLVAQVAVDFEAFKRTLEIVLKASRGSHARIMVEYEAGQLVITRAKSFTTITAVGSWSGKATFYDDNLLMKLPHLRAVDGLLMFASRMKGFASESGLCRASGKHLDRLITHAS